MLAKNNKILVVPEMERNSARLTKNKVIPCKQKPLLELPDTSRAVVAVNELMTRVLN